MKGTIATASLPRMRAWMLAMTLMLALVSAAFMLAGCSGGGSAGAPSTAEGTPGLEFGSARGGYEVTGYSGPEANVVIPDEYDGYPVVAVADRAFKEAQIESVTFGRNVATVGDGAFMRCDYLEAVNLNAALEEIGYEAFERCPNLKTVNVPADSSLKTIGTLAFFKCSALESFAVPLSTTYLGSACFKGCTNLERFTFGDGWKGNIDGSCFEGCTSLGSIDIPALESLGNAAFSGWSSAQSIHIGTGLEALKVCNGGYTFTIDELEQNGNLTAYDYWFEGCSAVVRFA